MTYNKNTAGPNTVRNELTSAHKRLNHNKQTNNPEQGGVKVWVEYVDHGIDPVMTTLVAPTVKLPKSIAGMACSAAVHAGRFEIIWDQDGCECMDGQRDILVKVVGIAVVKACESMAVLLAHKQ